MRQALVALTLLAAVFAGCASPGTPDTQVLDADAFDDVQVTDTTGAIRGVVVNEAIVPIAKVLVTLNTGLNTTTDAQGAFIFSELEPGVYFLTAALVGYKSVQQSADVTAGDAEPPITKITLVADKLAAPFTVQQTWDGFLYCGLMAGSGVLGFQACGPLDDRFIHYFTMDSGVPDYAQADMTWSSTQALGTDLQLQFYDGGTWYFDAISGPSPLMLNGTGDEITEWWSANATELPMRVFPGASQPLSVTFSQQFTVYMTMFYNFVPRQGWSFIQDGPCGAPDQCS